MIQKNPVLVIDLSKIRHDAGIIITLCKKYGIQVAAVTKGFCALPEIAEVTNVDGLTPLDKQVKFLRATNDHLIVNITNTDHMYNVGDIWNSNRITNVY